MAYVWYHVAGANGHGLGVKNRDNIENKGSTSPTFARPESCRGLASRSQQAAPKIAMTKPMTRPALAGRTRLHITRDAL